MTDANPTPTLPATDFENVALSALGVIAFIAKATKKKPTLLEILALPNEMTPLASVNWKNLPAEVLDLDSDESKDLLAKAQEKLAGVDQPMVKAVAQATLEAIQPSVAAVYKLKAIYDAFKAQVIPALGAQNG